MRYLEFYSYIVFSSVQAAVSAKAVRVSCFELFFVHAEYALKVKSDSVCPDCEVPRYISEFFRYMLNVDVVPLKMIIRPTPQISQR